MAIRMPMRAFRSMLAGLRTGVSRGRDVTTQMCPNPTMTKGEKREENIEIF
jgi:hypothetical protein